MMSADLSNLVSVCVTEATISTGGKPSKKGRDDAPNMGFGLSTSWGGD